MRKGMKITLIVAGALIAVGVVVFAAALAFGASWEGLRSRLNNGVTIGGYETEHWLDLDNGYAPEGVYSTAVDGIRGIDVRWTSGQVTVSSYDGAEIRFTESSPDRLTADTALRWGIVDGTLVIQAFPRGSVGILPEKQLEVLVPKTMEGVIGDFDFSGGSAGLRVTDFFADDAELDTASGRIAVENSVFPHLSVDTASGDVQITGSLGKTEVNTASGVISVSNTGGETELKVSTVSGSVKLSGAYSTLKVGTTSGDITGESAQARSLDVDSVSGRVEFSGSFDSAEVGTTSGDVQLRTDGCPEELEIETVSGSVQLTLPESSEFRLETDTVSGELTCDFPMIYTGNGEYVAGSGKNEFSIETTSGDIALRSKK